MFAYNFAAANVKISRIWCRWLWYLAAANVVCGAANWFGGGYWQTHRAVVGFKFGGGGVGCQFASVAENALRGYNGNLRPCVCAQQNTFAFVGGGNKGVVVNVQHRVGGRNELQFGSVNNLLIYNGLFNGERGAAVYQANNVGKGVCRFAGNAQKGVVLPTEG